MKALSILASGMVTSVGLDAPAACAAIRCGIDNFEETRFMDQGGEWIIGSAVPLDKPWRGKTKLINMIVPAIRECLTTVSNIPVESIPLILCIAETDRSGRLTGLDAQLIYEIETKSGVRFHEKSIVLPQGHIGGVGAIRFARNLIYKENIPFCLIAGVDSYLVAPTLAHYEAKDRLLTSKNSNGFLPGEAGAAVLVGPAGQTKEAELAILGIGFGQEKATVDSEEPLRADGLVQAIKAALADCGLPLHATDFRITDANGEQYYFKEATLALTRILRERKQEYDIWHPVDCIGEVGAAIGACVMGVALAAVKKGYSPGKRLLCHFGNDNGERAAMILSYIEKGAN